jgi:hypothetical protein
MSKIEVDAITEQSGTTLTVGGGASKTVVADATTVTLGRCGGTVALASGASQTGFGRTGTVDWQTGSIKTSDFTAVNTQGFFVDTNSGAITATLPAGSAGAIISFQDYRNTFDTNALTISPNGSEKINGGEGDVVLNTEGEGLTLVYIDSTIGWRSIQDNVFADQGANFLTATGGNAVVTCGNFKTHIFTGPGTFCVSSLGGGTPSNPNNVDYLVVAGGGGANGAGGFRMSNVHSLPSPTTSPLANPTGITVTAAAFPIVVGAGGASGGNPGSVSSFSTISSAGGGGGAGANGGSGASGQAYAPNTIASGSGNTPPVSPPQGNSAGSLTGLAGSGGADIAFNGGGGAGGASNNITLSPGPGASTPNACGGEGSFIADAFVGPTAPSYGTPGPVSSTRYFAGGGAGFSQVGAAFVEGGTGGSGGGGDANTAPIPTSDAQGGTNTGGGGSMAYNNNNSSGGSGIVMIRYKFQ